MIDSSAPFKNNEGTQQQFQFKSGNLLRLCIPYFSVKDHPFLEIEFIGVLKEGLCSVVCVCRYGGGMQPVPRLTGQTSQEIHQTSGEIRGGAAAH